MSSRNPRLFSTAVFIAAMMLFLLLVASPAQICFAQLNKFEKIFYIAEGENGIKSFKKKPAE